MWSSSSPHLSLIISNLSHHHNNQTLRTTILFIGHSSVSRQARHGTLSIVGFISADPPNPPSPGSQPCPVCEIGSDVSLIRKAYAALLSFVWHDVDEEDEEGEVRRGEWSGVRSVRSVR